MSHELFNKYMRAITNHSQLKQKDATYINSFLCYLFNIWWVFVQNLRTLISRCCKTWSRCRFIVYISLNPYVLLLVFVGRTQLEAIAAISKFVHLYSMALTKFCPEILCTVCKIHSSKFTLIWCIHATWYWYRQILRLEETLLFLPQINLDRNEFWLFQHFKKVWWKNSWSQFILTWHILLVMAASLFSLDLEVKSIIECEYKTQIFMQVILIEWIHLFEYNKIF